MKIWQEPVSFDWDKGNSDKNLKKHNVANQEAEEVFSNDPLIVSEDKRHSGEEEQRFQALGKTNKNRMLFLSFTIREEKVRLISIRDMNKKEQAIYEKA